MSNHAVHSLTMKSAIILGFGCLNVLSIQDNCYTEFGLYPDIVGKICPSEEQLFREDGRATLSACAYKCEQISTCVSFFYSYISKTCVVCDYEYTDVPLTDTLEGSLYYNYKTSSYKYLGCYAECTSSDISVCPDGPAFAFQTAISDSEVTPEYCSSMCFDSSYFGINDGYNCFCVDEGFQRYISREDTCDSPCRGNAGQICGGSL